MQGKNPFFVSLATFPVSVAVYAFSGKALSYCYMSLF